MCNIYYHFNHILLFFLCKCRIEWKTDYMGINFFCIVTMHISISMLLVIRMHINWNVMNIYRDPLIPKLFKHLSSIAVLNLNDIQVPSTFCFRQLIRGNNIFTIRKCLIIPRYNFLAPCQKRSSFFIWLHPNAH